MLEDLHPRQRVYGHRHRPILALRRPIASLASNRGFGAQRSRTLPRLRLETKLAFWQRCALRLGSGIITRCI
jgi:hypothetical protein